MRRMRTLAALLAMLVVAGCGGSVDRLGQAANTTVTLSGLSAQGPDEVATFATTVDQLSGGRLRLDIQEATASGPGAEPAVVDKVRSGAADIGFAAARVWPTEGSHAFDALQAPLLIDSYDLEQQVLTGDLVDGMTANLDVDGIAALGVLPGPLRYLAGRGGALRTPGDFAGLRIGISEASIPTRAVEALGAKAIPLLAGGPVDGLDGVEGHMSALVGNQYLASLPYVTGNLPLWPRPITVFMNRSRFAALSDQERSWLLAAARTVTPTRIRDLAKLDVEATGIACRTGARLESASAADRAALQAALQPVDDELRANAATANALDAIAQLKSGTPATLACDEAATTAPTPAHASTPVDGTWTSCPTVENIKAAGADAGEAQGNAGCVTLTFDAGVFAESGASAADGSSGSYAVDGDQLTIERANRERFAFTFFFFRDTLVLSLPKDPAGVSPAPWRALPFSREGG